MTTNCEKITQNQPFRPIHVAKLAKVEKFPFVMLLSFAVANFRSFSDEQTFSLVASNRQADHPEHLISIPDDENMALPVAAIYGANGAGKSNLVKALIYLRGLVTIGLAPKKPTGRQAFLLDKESLTAPTGFSIQFVEDGRVYAYGVKVGDLTIEEEWLSVVRNGRELPVFERVTKDGNIVVVEAGDILKEEGWGDHSKVVALSRVGVLPNQLFLHVVGASLLEKDQGPLMAAVLRWFSERLVIFPTNVAFSNLADLVSKDSEFTTFAGDFLRRIQTGVESLTVDTNEVDERMLGGAPGEIRNAISELPLGQTLVVDLNDGSQLIVEKAEGTRVVVRTIRSEHLTPDGSIVMFPFTEESDGTQRITQLLPALYCMKHSPRVFVIDEIDRSLHPLLAKGFVSSFLKSCISGGAQLVFTTHDTTFLDLDLLRRDEIWFANKRMPEAFTELYSLSDYKVRTDLKVDKAYLQGRFEAVPPIETEMPDWVDKIMDELRPGGGVEKTPTPTEA